MLLGFWLASHIHAILQYQQGDSSGVLSLKIGRASSKIRSTDKSPACHNFILTSNSSIKSFKSWSHSSLSKQCRYRPWTTILIYFFLLPFRAPCLRQIQDNSWSCVLPRFCRIFGGQSDRWSNRMDWTKKTNDFHVKRSVALNSSHSFSLFPNAHILCMVASSQKTTGVIHVCCRSAKSSSNLKAFSRKLHSSPSKRSWKGKPKTR